MDNATDMSTPVTRGELREEIELLEQRLEQRFDLRLEQRLEQFEIRLEQKLEQKLAHMASKADLEIWGGALLDRLMTELARHTKAVQEALSMQIAIIDEKYADLPARVSHLETAVFPHRGR